MQELLDLAAARPRRSLDAGEVLLPHGTEAGRLFVLLDGALRVEKEGVAIATIADPGACVGEVSLLLDIAATADVVAAQPSTVAVLDDAKQVLAENPRLAVALAQLLALRVQRMTTYLVDLQHQYADHEGGLGMVDVVLSSLMHRSGDRSEFGSERDPQPEY